MKINTFKPLLLSMLFLSTFSYADSIRTSDGILCSFDSGDTPYELSTYIEQGNNDSNYDHQNQYNSDERYNETKGGVELTYRFGGPDRLDCGKLYNLELRTKEAKVQMLEMKLKKLEAMQDINWE